jgi:hypothetical protein
LALPSTPATSQQYPGAYLFGKPHFMAQQQQFIVQLGQDPQRFILN